MRLRLAHPGHRGRLAAGIYQASLLHGGIAADGPCRAFALLRQQLFDHYRFRTFSMDERRAPGAYSGRGLGRLRKGVRTPVASYEEPPVSEILDVDREYRERAVQGDLPRIAPRRMNPAKEAWLPVLRTERGPRHYTALFSNTPRAHSLGKTRDWVVLYFDADGSERQCTVITSERGPLRGKRIVRGREAECAHYYAALE